MHRSENIYLPLAVAHLDNGNPHWIYTAKDKWILANSRQWTNAAHSPPRDPQGRRGIPKQEIPLSLAKQPKEFELLKQYQNQMIINNLFLEPSPSFYKMKMCKTLKPPQMN